MKYVNDSKAAKSISAYIILKDGEFVGKCQVHHGDSRTYVNLWLEGFDCGVKKGEDYTTYCAYGQASGYGYNKEHSAVCHAIREFIQDTFKEYKDYSQFDGRGILALEDYGYVVMQAI